MHGEFGHVFTLAGLSRLTLLASVRAVGQQETKPDVITTILAYWHVWHRYRQKVHLPSHALTADTEIVTKSAHHGRKTGHIPSGRILTSLPLCHKWALLRV